MTTAKLKTFVADSPLPPMTCTVKLAFVTTPGVPLMTPPELKVKPGGRLPEKMDHVYGVVLPVAANDWL
ncbi:MAG: hypothetical protein WCG06_00240 [Candidatus Omnitrophota bacterium]